MLRRNSSVPFPVTFVLLLTCSYLDSTLLSTSDVCLQFGERVDSGGAVSATFAASANVSGLMALPAEIADVASACGVCFAAPALFRRGRARTTEVLPLSVMVRFCCLHSSQLAVPPNYFGDFFFPWRMGNAATAVFFTIVGSYV